MASTSVSPASAATSSAGKRWLGGLKRLFTWVALAAMAVAVWKSWGFLAGAWSQVAVGNVVAAVALWSATHFVSPACTVLVLGRSKAIDYRSAWQVHALRLPAKYLPGGIWHMAGRVVDLRGLGHAPRSLVEFVLMENLVAAAFALGTGATLLLASGETRWRGLLAVVAVLGLLGLVLVPRLVKLVGRTESAFPADRYARLIAVTAGFWALAAAAFLLFVTGFGSDVMQANPAAKIGTYLFSWGAGFVAFFAPQGVGVFEFVSATMLGDKLDLARAVALMASFRVVVLAGDLSAWVIAIALSRGPGVR